MYPRQEPVKIAHLSFLINSSMVISVISYQLSVISTSSNKEEEGLKSEISFLMPFKGEAIDFIYWSASRLLINIAIPSEVL